jgi:bleomycin hydrolase
MKKFIYLLLALLNIQLIQAQISNKKTFTNIEGSQYKFKLIKLLDATSVKNQNRTGTCWSFSGLSFFESELLRKGKGEYNLSEMWIARNAYIGKARNYLFMDGHLNFGGGGEFHDIPWVINHYGLVPESAYLGKAYGEDKHNHSELHKILKAVLDVLKDKPQNGKLTKSWLKAYKNILDAYLGDVPENEEDFRFNYNGKEFSPKSFAKSLDLDMDDYIELTSFTHHPFYKPYTLELADNWQLHQAYNIPLDELLQISENAILKGYTFAWGADVSEKGFSHRKGLAILPADERTVQDKRSTKESFGKNEQKIPNAFYHPVPQKEVSVAERQESFENGTTTDDHGMHIVGIVKDQKGTKYFVVKNSWGTEYNSLNGYFLVSYSFFKYKTIDVFVHKNALPKDLRKKLNIN